VTKLCHVEIGNLAEWFAAATAVATAIIAGIALSAWRDQIRGTSRHAAGAEIAEAARLMKYHFYDARNPWYDTGEFSPSYRAQTAAKNNAEEAAGWAHVFQNRYSLLSEQIHRLAILRAKASKSLMQSDSG
jgi:Tfp pilus assembly protein PilE